MLYVLFIRMYYSERNATAKDRVITSTGFHKLDSIH